MSLSSWLSKTFVRRPSRPTTCRVSAPPRSRLGLEALETRDTPSSGISTVTDVGSLYINTGTAPAPGLIMDGSGNLYGTAENGGASGDGTVFEILANHHTTINLASFNGTDGRTPGSGVIMDASGNLYGTTESGGVGGGGTVFEIAAGSHTITTLSSFTAASGRGPVNGLIMDASGNLYGTTYFGGPNEDGTVFEVAKGSGTVTVLAAFGGPNSPLRQPTSGLVTDGSGDLYGIARGGIYELAAGSNTLVTLAPFTPSGLFGAGLVIDGNGNLYGTGRGTIFELAKGSDTVTTLTTFTAATGYQPNNALLMDASGNLYGTTPSEVGTPDGTVFEMAAGTGAITTLATLTGTNGRSPNAGLVMDANGNLYGTAIYGGPYQFGAVFEVSRGQPNPSVAVTGSGPAAVAATAPPVAPVGLTAVASVQGGADQVQLQWADRASDAAGFIVQRSADGGATWTSVVVLIGDSDTYIDTTVGSGTSYEYRVCAFNALGDSSSSNVVALTTP